MHKAVIALSVGSFLFASTAFAVCTVESFVPTDYTQGADTITVHTNLCTDELGIYLTGSSSLPYAYKNNLGVNYGDKNLVGLSWTTGGFSTSNMPIGAYHTVVPQSVSCYNLSYAACSAANTEIPGLREADFDVEIPVASSTVSTTTLSAADMLLTYLFYIVDAFWWLLVFFAVIAGLSFVFPIFKTK